MSRCTITRATTPPPTARPDSTANALRGTTSENSGAITSAAENKAASTIHRTDQALFRISFQSAWSCTIMLLESSHLRSEAIFYLAHFPKLTFNAV